MDEICIIIPTYNNAGSLCEVLEKTLLYGLPVFVINDGSTDKTAELLEKYASKIELISYPKNRGKGYALRQGFAAAFRKNFSYAITIDSDGQHNPADIPLFIAKLRQTGEALILGKRNLTVDNESENESKNESKNLLKNIPKKSSFGKRFSNFWFWVETWTKCSDTQTGFRLYPLKPLMKRRFFTDKFEFEIESLVRLAWDNVPVTEIDVSVVYFPKEERISHFRPGRDFFRISVLNSILFILAYLWFLPRLFFLKLKDKTWKEILLNPSESNLKKAQSIGFGVFMGIIPIWGFQMIVAFALAIPLKLNKILVLFASNISIPPMIPAIIFGSLRFGSLALQTEQIIQFSTEISFADIGNMVLQYVVGSVILAVLAGSVAFGAAYLLLKTIRK